MKYQLKKGQESFEVVDGEFAGRKYVRGKTYDKIPPAEAKKFEKIEDSGQSATQTADKKSEDRGQKKKTPEPLNPEPGTATERSKP